MNKNKHFVYVGLLILVFILSGCTLSASKIDVESPSDPVYTIAAKTIIAQYTQDAEEVTGSGLVATETAILEESNVTMEETQEIDIEPDSAQTPIPTQEPSPTNTITSSPTVETEPEPIWKDDFTNHTQWYSDEGNDYGFKYQDDEYLIYNNLLNASIWSLGYIGLSDVKIVIDTKYVDGPEDGYSGVFCRHSNEGQNYYGLVIGADGFYGIMKMVGGEKEFIESGFDENDIINKGKSGENHIEGVCAGNNFILSVNDQILLEVSDDTLADGGVGLLAGNKLSGVGTKVLFDNFAIYDVVIVG